jgi:hypothetical protein
MNIQKLNRLEDGFLTVYKEGFKSTELKELTKKHNLQKQVDNIHKVCSKESFETGLNMYDDLVKIVGRSSVVSVFEKMKFRDLSKEFDLSEKHMLIDAVYELIHGDEELGFNMVVQLLAPYKLAKWPIITIFRSYYYPYTDIFVKPTTVKKIIKYLELEHIEYSSKANYLFYNKYRQYFNILKDNIRNDTVKPNNPAFSGFLRMMIQ